MRLETQREWHIGYMRSVRELARLRVRALRLVAVSASMADGVGVRGVRGGAYTVGDMLLLARVVAVDLPGPMSKRIAELEVDVIPKSREQVRSLDNLARRFGQ